MNYLDQILEVWLPTKSSRLIAGLSTTLGASAFLLPEFLSTLNIQIPDHLTLLIRIATPVLIWLLVSLFVLYTVVQYYKNLNLQKQLPPPILPPIAKPTELPKEQTDILLLLFKQGNRLARHRSTRTIILVRNRHREKVLNRKQNNLLTSGFTGLPKYWQPVSLNVRMQ